MKKKNIYKIRDKGFIKVRQVALSSHPKAEIFQKALHKHRVISNWEKAIVQFFENADNQTKAVDFQDGLLSVACLSKELAYRLKLFAQRIIYALNQLLGKELVFALKVEY